MNWAILPLGIYLKKIIWQVYIDLHRDDNSLKYKNIENNQNIHQKEKT